MKPIRRTKRPPRRIKVAGKWIGGHDTSREDENKTTSSAPAKRPSIITSGNLYNEVAAADYLGLAVSTLQNRRSLGEQPAYIKRGRRVFYRLEDLEKFANDN
ncbi:helix-turn-helix domain-containing protein [Aliiroseovarius sp. F47248L]|uniref:helix-turn-helix transcriptional regulator n=1 Tax=Aliiroseovarius sp. F47248L TaxID=2926420 RepID=UPI001FF0F1FA|nr:helix-turn-helix domain-containing protein [Aliiroseovarius sp. F47248L]MCK0139299.1 helix-turn-helix domain-containing protein [Aliiroseovarius sp. F47248L]